MSSHIQQAIVAFDETWDEHSANNLKCHVRKSKTIVRKKGTQTSDIIFAPVTLQTSNIISPECYFQQIQLTSKWLSTHFIRTRLWTAEWKRASLIFQIFYFFKLFLQFSCQWNKLKFINEISKCVSLSSNNFFSFRHRYFSLNFHSEFYFYTSLLSLSIRAWRGEDLLFLMLPVKRFSSSIPPLHFHNWIGPYFLQFYSKNLQSSLAINWKILNRKILKMCH